MTAKLFEFGRTDPNFTSAKRRILEQATKAGFSGPLKIYFLGLDSEDSMSLVIEGDYKGENCCVAVGYGMNSSKLAVRKKWTRGDWD
jgi:hypothetical protein